MKNNEWEVVPKMVGKRGTDTPELDGVSVYLARPNYFSLKNSHVVALYYRMTHS